MFLNISYNLQSPICVGHYGLHPFSQRPLRSPRQTGWSVLDVEEATDPGKTAASYPGSECTGSRLTEVFSEWN